VPAANWAGNVTFAAEAVHRPETVDDLRRLVAASNRVRALGSGHSFNRVADTDRDLVRLDGLPRTVELDPVAGTVAVIRSGAVHAVITERRKPYHLVSDFTDLGLNPHAADVVVVKIGYLEPELYEMAADWRLALTPGGVDQDLARLGHSRIERPMFPFDDDMPDPQLRAVLRRRGQPER
jgi:microcystin degradation protein MlrC